jgi:tetratricopeptide (TPR) repeat protein
MGRLTPLLARCLAPWLCLVASAAWAESPTPALPATDAAADRALAVDDVFGGALRAYHHALLTRRLGQQELRLEDVAARVAEGEQLTNAGRVDEAIARLAELVEHPQFELYSDAEEGQAAVFSLGDALATAGIDEPARAYLRRVLELKTAWEKRGTWARRAVRRLVDVALESGGLSAVSKDLGNVSANAPEDVRGEIAYVMGRASEGAGNPQGALAAYAMVTQRCRFWAEATYLSGLIHVERGDFKRAEDLLCKVADPRRSASTTAVFADEKFFAVRDLARLGLGRIAHEQGRNDNARYYYYLVPRDSERLAEALYEAATTRYEKTDYDGAHELLTELARFSGHHRYEDEAWVLGAWVDLARCRFADADKKLVEFLARYEPVRDAARRIGENEVAMQRLLSAVHAGTDAAGAEVGTGSPEVIRTIAALLRVDVAYDRVLRRRAVLEREASGLVHGLAAISDMQRALATNGGVRSAIDQPPDDAQSAREARSGIQGIERQLTELESAGAPASRLQELRQELGALKARLAESEAGAPSTARQQPTDGADLVDLLRADATRGAALGARVMAARAALASEEEALAKDALARLDLRLSRLLRRARLGRIESVLGRKRALEVEVEAIRLGYLPQDAVDSLEAARYLEDSEEYWPFEGDDWPDEYVGSEVK